ncbi:transcription termination factor NusA [soil metagenome]
MVTYDELVNLAKKSQGNYSLTEDELIGFVKGGAVRAYKAGDASRTDEDVSADFNAQTKELRLSVRKKVVAETKDPHIECTEAEGKASLGEVAEIAVLDTDTYKAIDAAIKGMKSLIESGWKKENVDLVKTKFQEFKDHCLSGKLINTKTNSAVVSISAVDCLLPTDEQLPNEKLEEDADLIVYVKELRQTGETWDIIVSRQHPGLVSYAMRQVIPEVDLGNIEIKSVARIAGKHSRVAVVSKDMGAVERCQAKATKVSQLVGGETVDFVEWYADTKAYIASSLKMEVRDVHIIESEKQALVEVFKEQANDANADIIKLAQDLTGYKIEIKTVAKDAASELPGV